jgi:hypothetical protein
MMQTGNNNKRVLILPDIHLKWKIADKIIWNVGADEIIFLGDYFDDFGDNVQMVKETCDWLEYSVNQPNHIHLFGNHDLHYAFANRYFTCSGYTDWKYFAIRDKLDGKKVWDKLKYYHILDNKWLLTHAGLHNLNVPAVISDLHNDREKFYSQLTKYLDEEIRKGHRNQSWIFHAGHARGGNQRVGGITWCDFNQEFYPVRGLNQILGHSPQQFGSAMWNVLDNESDTSDITYYPHREYHMKANELDDTSKSHNICLDVQDNMHWAIWDGKNIEFFNYKDDL